MLVRSTRLLRLHNPVRKSLSGPFRPTRPELPLSPKCLTSSPRKVLQIRTLTTSGFSLLVRKDAVKNPCKGSQATITPLQVVCSSLLSEKNKFPSVLLLFRPIALRLPRVSLLSSPRLEGRMPSLMQSRYSWPAAFLPKNSYARMSLRVRLMQQWWDLEKCPNSIAEHFSDAAFYRSWWHTRLEKSRWRFLISWTLGCQQSAIQTDSQDSRAYSWAKPDRQAAV